MKKLLRNSNVKQFVLRLVAGILLACLFLFIVSRFSFEYDSIVSMIAFFAISTLLSMLILWIGKLLLGILFTKFNSVSLRHVKALYFILDTGTLTVMMKLTDYLMKGVALSNSAILLFAVLLGLYALKIVRLRNSVGYLLFE